MKQHFTLGLFWLVADAIDWVIVAVLLLEGLYPRKKRKTPLFLSLS